MRQGEEEWSRAAGAEETTTDKARRFITAVRA